MPQITLTTDFGASDHYVAAMKGVISGIAPRNGIVDITHDITPFQIAEAAFVIGEAYRWFPKGTIHVVVVDPGVGTARRPILVQAAGQLFLGPDNGVLSRVYGRSLARVREVTAKKYFLRNPSATFHGRDVFAPVAAHLARGAKPAQLGKLIQDYLRPSFERPERTSKRTWEGQVLKADRFGNLITNYHVDEFPELLERPFSFLVGLRPVERLLRTFAEAERGEVCALVGSSGYIEIVVNQGSAARTLGCASGSPVELTIY